MTVIKDPTQSPQDRMMAEIVQGAGDEQPVDFSVESILARGCDPQMAHRASTVMPTVKPRRRPKRSANAPEGISRASVMPQKMPSMIPTWAREMSRNSVR